MESQAATPAVLSAKAVVNGTHDAAPTPATPTSPEEAEVNGELDHDNGNESAGDAEPTETDPLMSTAAAAKKKKKKKPKKKGNKEANGDASTPPVNGKAENGKKEKKEEPPVLCISRNKHWRYISSYHGPWLQLPVELLESLLILNIDVNSHSPPSSPSIPGNPRRGSHAHPHMHISQPTSPIMPSASSSEPQSPASLLFNSSKPTPPPIDPGVFRSVTTIRRLIDEASDLAVRAASGLSAAALTSLPSHNHQMSWASQSLGLNPLGGESGGRNGGREASMSAMRTHRLRALAVQRLAQAYKADEIAASVMVMQGASALDDVAQRVLKHEPNNADAKYVHFFHEKIPSRQLAESTPTTVLDELIAEQPLRLEYHRTRGIVRCFRDEYAQACRDFTHALKQAIQLRKARHAHGAEAEKKPNRVGKGKNGKKARTKEKEQTCANDSHDGVNGDDADEPAGDASSLHPSAGLDAPDPLEAQCLFLRGAAYLQHSVYLIESACLALEGVRKPTSPDVPELRLCYLEHGKYGGTEIGHADGPLGSRDGAKLRAYRARLGAHEFRQTVFALLRKSVRDHEKFLAQFDTLETGAVFPGDLAQRTEAAFLLSESQRPGQQHQHQQLTGAPLPLPDGPAAFTTYHPLLVESHFSILICHLLLGDFAALLPAFARTAMLVDGLEGYPIFLPARSMAQAEFIEVLERLTGWKAGVQPHHLAIKRPAIEPASGSPDASGPSSPTTKASSTSTSASSAPSSRSDTPTSSSAAKTKPASPTSTAASAPTTSLAENLDCARMLLAPVLARQRRRAEKERADRAAGVEKKKGLINIPLHGPRVEIVLAWLGAVHLPDLEGVPQPEPEAAE